MFHGIASHCGRFFILLVFMAGCSSASPQLQNTPDLARINREQAATIQSLHKEVQRLNQEIQNLLTSPQAHPLSQTQIDLENSLRLELQAGDLDISMQEKGLVVTVLDRVLFDPGQAELKASSLQTLQKVARVLTAEAAGHVIYIEGHTDNQPIRVSGWRSNWELSTARAAEVVHYFVDQMGIEPQRLAATGYGEFQPVVLNDTPEGRMQNRRVEIVISPKKIGG